MSANVDLTELRERVAGLTGADRRTDALIAKHIDQIRFRSTKRGREWLEDSHGGVETWVRHPPAYTGSIDVALAFVERVLPGCAVRIQRNLDGCMWAELQRRSADPAKVYDVWNDSGNRASLPIALVLAAIDAWQAQP